MNMVLEGTGTETLLPQLMVLMVEVAISKGIIITTKVVGVGVAAAALDVPEMDEDGLEEEAAAVTVGLDGNCWRKRVYW